MVLFTYVYYIRMTKVFDKNEINIMKQNENNDPETVTIVSLDYDGCGDILFYDIDNGDYFYKENMKSKAKDIQSELMVYLDTISSQSKCTELYVGSARQDICMDENNESFNDNGSCFKNYKKICESKEWIFQTLLLVDIHNDVVAGSAMNDRNICCNFLPSKNKNDIILHQIKDARNNHPSAVINFYFFDDKSTILKNTYKYFLRTANYLTMLI